MPQNNATFVPFPKYPTGEGELRSHFSSFGTFPNVSFCDEFYIVPPRNSQNENLVDKRARP